MDYPDVETKRHVVFEKPNYTQTPNILFDELMKDMSESELKVTLCIIRKIVGYHKFKPEAVSLSQIQEMTGLSRQAVLDGLEQAISRGIIARAGTGKRGVSLFQLVHNSDQSEIQTRTSQQSRPELVNKVDTQKKGKKKKENILPVQAQASAVSTKPSKQEYEDLLDAIEKTLLVKGSRRLKYYHLLQGTSKADEWKDSILYFASNPVLAPELLAFGAWYAKNCPNASIPTKADVLEDWITRFRQQKQSKPTLNLSAVADTIYNESNLATDGVIPLPKRGK